ncbi:MAG TPA: hypothetical protein VNO51_16540, partial [Ilumatobacteraceae bacterium]|nr:hypothetical protein [Ilumatobacteraceae bacterium]
MAPSSSSTKKAARLAQKGKGKKVRFQGGTLFPLIVAIVMVLGLGTIVYARQTVPADDSSPPTVNDHWHAAYGFLLCDGTYQQLVGNLEETNSAGQLISNRFLQTGIHSHDDGVMHWHPYTSRAVGKNAKLGVFLDVYEVELDNDALRFPDNQLGGEDYIEGETKCGTDDAELQVVVWDSFSDTDDGTTYIANFDNIPIRQDGMVFAIAFVPRDTDIQMPPWAADLVALGAVDLGQVPPADVTGTTGTATDGTVTDATVTDGTVTG